MTNIFSILSKSCLLVLFAAIMIPQLASAEGISDIDYTVPVTLGLSESTVASSTLEVQIASPATPLNFYQVVLQFNPSALEVTDVVMHENLCDSRFVIMKRIDNINGVVEVICGTIVPFQTQEASESILTLSYETLDPALPTNLAFGLDTGFYIHDGYGTQALLEISSAQ